MNAHDWPPLDAVPANALAMFVVYDHPIDYPEYWVVRRWIVAPSDDDGRPVREVMDVVPRLALSLAEARALVPRGLYRQARLEGDDPFIAETWF
jgi:hypothetical protein